MRTADGDERRFLLDILPPQMLELRLTVLSSSGQRTMADFPDVLEEKINFHFILRTGRECYSH